MKHGEIFMKRNIFVAAAFVAILFSSCAKKTSALKIGVIQLVEHPALDNNYKGFIDGLAEAGYVAGENIVIDYENAQGEQSNCVTIAQKLVNDKNDLIFAIATPAAQAVANQTSEIPILVSSVTDPASAQLVNSNEHPGVNVSGTSDLTPCAAQMDLLKRLFPNAKKIRAFKSILPKHSATCSDLNMWKRRFPTRTRFSKSCKVWWEKLTRFTRPPTI